MTSSVSNDTGRALEYEIVEEFIEYCISKKILFKLSSRTEDERVRDKKYFESLSKKLQEDFIKCAKTFIKWSDREKWFENTQEISIDRLPDSMGVQGDATDIKFYLMKEGRNIEKDISVKNNHNALKHPRLPRLPEQCGINDDKIKEKYIEDHNLIWKKFKELAEKLNSKATKFNELKKIDPSFIDKNLYKPLIELVIFFMKKNLIKEENLKFFFQFLTGKTNFITIKNEQDHILVKHFEKIKIPKKFKITYPADTSLTTFLMELDNKWKITFRLHTASEHFIEKGKLKTSVKFDVICPNLDEVLEIEMIAKD